MATFMRPHLAYSLNPESIYDHLEDALKEIERRNKDRNRGCQAKYFVFEAIYEVIPTADGGHEIRDLRLEEPSVHPSRYQ